LAPTTGLHDPEVVTATLPVPDVIVFDVNETLSDTAALAGVFADVGAPEHLAATWFAAVLRDGFALTAAGAPARFGAVAAAAARSLLAASVPGDRLDAAVDQVVSAMSTLPVHPDVPDGVRALARRGTRLVTLTNGSRDVGRRVLSRAGLEEEFERLLSVEDGGGAWKPAAEAYRSACRAIGVEPGRALLVAVHPWDVDGAARAGLRTAWVDRRGAPYPAVFTTPDLTVSGIEELAAQWGS